jgi:plasmid stabilization system protein ParE
MAHRVDVTPSAARDLVQIWEYIAADSLDAADRVIERIRGEFQRLAAMPGMGHTRKELGPEYRVWGVYSYLVVYRPDVRPIQIIRVVSGWRDLGRIKW